MKVYKTPAYFPGELSLQTSHVNMWSSLKWGFIDDDRNKQMHYYTYNEISGRHYMSQDGGKALQSTSLSGLNFVVTGL